MNLPNDAYAESLQTRKGQAWHEYTSLVDGAAEETRDLSAEERETLECIEADLDALNAEETRHAQRVASVDLADSIRSAAAPAAERATRRHDPTDADIIRALIGTGDEATLEHRSQTFGFENTSLGQSLETRALGDTADGGSAVVTNFADRLVSYERTLNPVTAVANVIVTPDNSPLTIFRQTADQAYGGTVTAENAGIVAADPTLSSVTLFTYKYPSITFISSELWRSNAINLEDEIARWAGRELGLDLGTHLTTGDGSDKPEGFLTNATNGGTASGTAVDQATDTFFGPSDLIDLLQSPAAPYAVSGSWMVAVESMTKIRKMKDSNGNFLYNPLGEGIVRAINGSLLGRPVYQNPAMAAPASATKSIAFGDFGRFYVRRLAPRVDVSSEFKFQNDQIAVRTIVEADSSLVDTAAIHYLVSAND